MVELLYRLDQANLIHGDMKATNLIEHKERDSSQMVLIDFDGLAQGRSAKDRNRLLANWQDDPALLAAWTDKVVAKLGRNGAS